MLSLHIVFATFLSASVLFDTRRGSPLLCAFLVVCDDLSPVMLALSVIPAKSSRLAVQYTDFGHLVTACPPNQTFRFSCTTSAIGIATYKKGCSCPNCHCYHQIIMWLYRCYFSDVAKRIFVFATAAKAHLTKCNVVDRWPDSVKLLYNIIWTF